jgi:4-hydroxybenzoate polyprenyltransferase
MSHVAVGEARLRSVSLRAGEALALMFVSMRPRQWIKNLFVFAALVFSQQAFTSAVWPALAAFTVFCGLSGAIYLLNDLADREQDRAHPQKRRRPIASGRLSPRVAVGTAVLLILLGLGCGLALSVAFAVTAALYVFLAAAYSAVLKQFVILDVILVAIGFVLRAVAGGLAIGIHVSGWLLICTLLIALFLALGKRRHEYFTLGDSAGTHRPVLREYSPAFIDQMIAVVTASTVTAYALYTMSPETSARLHTQMLPLTLPFVLYGIFRYLYLLYRRQLGGNPSELLLHDLPLLLDTVLWLGTLLVIIYGPRVW